MILLAEVVAHAQPAVWRLLVARWPSLSRLPPPSDGLARLMQERPSGTGYRGVARRERHSRRAAGAYDRGR